MVEKAAAVCHARSRELEWGYSPTSRANEDTFTANRTGNASLLVASLEALRLAPLCLGARIGDYQAVPKVRCLMRPQMSKEFFPTA
jgi:hypothetical protein